jgi:hypothetical protein
MSVQHAGAQGDGSTWQFEEVLDTELLVADAGLGTDSAPCVTSCSCMFGHDYDPSENPAGTVWQFVPADEVPAGAETAPLAEGDKKEEKIAEEREKKTEGGDQATPAAGGTPAG